MLACVNVEQKMLEKNPTIQEPPSLPEETKFADCKCAQSYTYKGKTFTGGECTTMDWPVPWCATENCGIPIDKEFISTGECAHIRVRVGVGLGVRRETFCVRGCTRTQGKSVCRV